MKHFQDYNENYDTEVEYSGIKSQKDLYTKKKKILLGNILGIDNILIP